MTAVPKKAPRNQSMECVKLVASFFVVFIHVWFPGRMGGLIDCVARFGVPTFFAISGYFSYGADHKKLLRRAWHIGKLYLAGLAVSVVLGSAAWVGSGGQLREFLSWFSVSPEVLSRMLLLCDSTFYNTQHMWYLISMFQCYLLMALYVRFFEEGTVSYKPLYGVSFVLYVIHLLLGVIGIAAQAGLGGLYRNALFFAVPMFSLGLFLREYQQHLFRRYALTEGKLLLTAAAGVILSVLQFLGVGIGEMPFGMVLTAISLMLLTANRPVLAREDSPAGRIIGSFGTVSMVVYIVHLSVYNMYNTFLIPGAQSALGQWEPWLRPVLVALLSALIGICWHGILCMTRKGHKAS